MIPKIFIEQWQNNFPWQSLDMVEQDLIIGRALVCLYSNPEIKNNLVFRGGTALNKLYLKPSSRYSEDLDFVQKDSAVPIGKTMDKVRSVLDSWLGEPKRIKSEHSSKLIYRYSSVNNMPMRLKIEVNTEETFQILKLREKLYGVNSKWFNGECLIPIYQIEELMATKIRALYQRRKGRDLFDLWLIFNQNLANVDESIVIFKKYCERAGIKISKTLFLENLELKRLNQDFQTDMNILLPDGAGWNFEVAFDYVVKNIVNKL